MEAGNGFLTNKNKSCPMEQVSQRDRGNQVQGLILIVDAIAINRIALKVPLDHAHYNVLQAADIKEALSVASQERPDLIISAVSLADGDIADLRKRLSLDPVVRDVPLLGLAPQISRMRRIAALRAGVQDVLTLGSEPGILLAHVRSLIRAYHNDLDLRVQDSIDPEFELAEAAHPFHGQSHTVLVSPGKHKLQVYASQLRPLMEMRVSLSDTRDAIPQADAYVLVLPDDPCGAQTTLSIIPTLRAHTNTRYAAVLVVQPKVDFALGAQALDLGADGLMTDGFEAAELACRTRMLVKRKQRAERLRAALRIGLTAAVTDPLTGLHNRRFALPKLNRIASQCAQGGQTFAVLAADLDHFKRINDRYGHASGDAVLVEVARRLKKCMRMGDMVARMGGEEFLIVMPATSLIAAQGVATRLCSDISGCPFDVPGNKEPITVTISIGMILAENGLNQDVSAEALLERADQALYAAKGKGRNRVTLGRPAA